MPRPRTPTRVLDARGAFKKNPNRKRGGEPTVETPVGSPPGYFSKDQVAVWHEIASNAPPGVLTSADAITLEIAATMLAEFRADSKAFTTARLTQLRAVLGSFGMNPSDRAKLDIPKAPNENPFAKIGK